MKPGKHQRSKQRCQDLCWKVHTDGNVQSFFGSCSHAFEVISTMFIFISIKIYLPADAEGKKKSKMFLKWIFIG